MNKVQTPIGAGKLPRRPETALKSGSLLVIVRYHHKKHAGHDRTAHNGMAKIHEDATATPPSAE